MQPADVSPNYRVVEQLPVMENTGRPKLKQAECNTR